MLPYKRGEWIRNLVWLRHCFRTQPVRTRNSFPRWETCWRCLNSCSCVVLLRVHQTLAVQITAAHLSTSLNLPNPSDSQFVPCSPPPPKTHLGFPPACYSTSLKLQDCLNSIICLRLPTKTILFRLIALVHYSLIFILYCLLNFHTNNIVLHFLGYLY